MSEQDNGSNDTPSELELVKDVTGASTPLFVDQATADKFAQARAALSTSQANFIVGQAQYINNHDVEQIVDAQRIFIIDLFSIIENLDKGELAATQEQVYKLLQDKLNVLGVL